MHSDWQKSHAVALLSFPLLTAGIEILAFRVESVGNKAEAGQA